MKKKASRKSGVKKAGTVAAVAVAMGVGAVTMPISSEAGCLPQMPYLQAAPETGVFAFLLSLISGPTVVQSCLSW